MQGFGDGKLAFAFAVLIGGGGEVVELCEAVAGTAGDILADLVAKRLFTAGGNGTVDLGVEDHIVSNGLGGKGAFGDLAFAAAIILTIAAHRALYTVWQGFSHSYPPFFSYVGKGAKLISKKPDKESHRDRFLCAAYEYSFA